MAHAAPVLPVTKVPARSIQTALADKIPYEQSSLQDILTYLDGSRQGDGPLFNVWVNLLWMQSGGVQSPRALGEHAVAELFKPLAIVVPTDFMPSTPFADAGATATSVSILDTSFLPRKNLYIDIGPDVRTDSIGFGIRGEGGLMEETEAHTMVTSVGEEIVQLVSSLEP